VIDAVSGVLGGDGYARGVGGEVEPAALEFYVADDVGVVFAAGAHEAGADGGDADAFVAEFGVEAFGEADESELAGDVREHVGHGELAADAGDVDDGCVTVDGVAAEKMRESGVGGVEGGEEVGGHGAAIGGDGLVFYGPDFDDAGVIDEHVDAAEVADGVVDEHGGLDGVGEVGGDEEDVVGGFDGSAVQEGVASSGELFKVACSEDEFGSGSGVALGESEAEAAGTSGDEDDLAGAPPGGGWPKRVGGCCGEDSGDDLSGVECGSGPFHGYSVRC